ncbi:MAG: redoxin domain-containing protein [Planctomycetes bacterium]|nr:redoxin domain-containing protein [Planctomycetota bacterium]
MIRHTVVAATAALLITGPAFAGEDEDLILGIGDRAPALDVAHWVKTAEGQKPPVAFEEGKVYVMEFWATWCGPCRRGMPHISEVQERFADYDVTIIGVSDEPLPVVYNFLVSKDKEDTQWNDKMRYTVATDPDRSVYLDYMLAAGQNGIPTAFIIGKTGEVEWIGHPGWPEGAFDAALDGVVRDTWDRAEFKASWDKKMAPMIKDIIPRLKLERAKAAGDWDTVIDQLDVMIAAKPNDLNATMEKFNLLLKRMNRPAQAYALGHTMIDAHWDNPQLLNMMAWTVVDDPAIVKRDLAFATKAAERANELTKSKDPAVLDTVARIWFEKGDYQKAVKWQSKAVDLVGDHPMASDLKKALERYEKALDN